MNRLTYQLSAAVSGIFFGLGLLLSGMTNPKKVIGFLDITDNWDPSLAFVMGGAILVGVLGFKLIKRRQYSLFKQSIDFSNKTKPSLKVVVGSIIFGIGWGISGICPGPGIVNLGTGSLSALVFVLGLSIGAAIYPLIKRPQNDN